MFNQLAKKVTIFVAVCSGSVFGQDWGPHCVQCAADYDQCIAPCVGCDWDAKWCRDCHVRCQNDYALCCYGVIPYQELKQN